MKLDFDIMVRMHRGEIPPREAFRLQAARDRAVEALQVGEPVAEARALLPKCVLALPIGAGLRAACASYGIRLECRECYHGHGAAFTAARNVVTWGMKRPHAWYAAGDRNVLYVENGLLGQRHGRYVDHRGYFADSSICADREYDRQATSAERAALAAHLQREFGWEPGATCDPAGPILVALQTPADAPLQHYCTRSGGDGRQYVIDAAAEFLPPDVPVLVRPHPRDEGYLQGEVRLPDGWTVDRSPNVYALLRTCRALVAANSTLAFEALGLGMPVACLGRHAFSGSGAVLECDGHPERLQQLLAWRPDAAAVERLLAAVLRHQIWARAGVDEWLRSTSFRTWAERCIRTQAVPVPVHPASGLEGRYAAACQRLRAGADPMLQDLVDATDDHLGGHCPACSRPRLMQRIVDQDLAVHGGREPVFSPATTERLREAGLTVTRPDLRGYRDRLRNAIASNTAPCPTLGSPVVLGFMYGGHLGDALVTTALAAPLRAAGHRVAVVRHRNTYAAFCGHGLAWQNAGRMRLNPPPETGSGHLCQRLLRWFGLPEPAYPRPDLRLSEKERSWAEQLLADLPRPRILVCPEARSNANGYADMPWQAWADALRESGSVVQVRQHGPELSGCRVISGLSLRQFVCLFSAADAYIGTYAAGIHAAAAFGLEAIVVCTPTVRPASLTFPSPQRHIVSFLYPQQAYGWFRAGATGRAMTPVLESAREARPT